jgi:hypothetical protein
MTDDEFYRLNGTLSPERIERLLDLTIHIDGSNPSNYIEEATATFPKEDFLEAVLKKLNRIAKNVRGDNRTDINDVIETLEQLATDTYNTSEYGRSELDNALAVINKIFG